MSINRLNTKVLPADTTLIMTAIADIRAKLPMLLNLSKDERHDLIKMGPKSGDFVRACLSVAQRHPEVLPGTFDVDEMEMDVTLADTLRPIRDELADLLERIDDTVLQAGSEAYGSALVVYHYAKGTSQGGALDTAADTMARRFARKITSTDTPPTPAA